MGERSGGEGLAALLVSGLVVLSGTVAVGAAAGAGAAASPAAAQDASPTAIDSCAAITEPGRYVLVADVGNATADPCIEIRASDVVLDGNGHAVTGGVSDFGAFLDATNRTGTFPTDPRWRAIGVAARGEDRLENVTVANLAVEGWYFGLYLDGVANATVRDVAATGNGDGISVYDGTEVAVRDSVARANHGGGFVFDSTSDSTVEGNAAVDNGLSGFAFYSTRTIDARTRVLEGTIADLEIERNVALGTRDGTGIEILAATDVTVSNAVAADNRYGGIVVASASDVTVADSTVRGNDFVGIGLLDSRGNRIANATIEGTTGAVSIPPEDSAGIGFDNASDNAIVDSIARNNANWTVYARGGSTNNTASNLTVDGRAVSFELTDVAVGSAERAPPGEGGDDTTPLGPSAEGGTTSAGAGLVVENTSEDASIDLRVGWGARAAEPDEEPGAIPDPERDVVGWEDGYWYNESVDVTQRDGLTDAELERWVDLAQAHVEYIVGREFTSDVDVQVLAPAEIDARSGGIQAWIDLLRDERYRAWTEQVEEARFIQGEDEDAYDAENLTAEQLLSGVYGYYEPADDELVVLRNASEPVAVDNATLVHELTHALQDQTYDLTDPKYNGETLDEYTGELGITEGQAAYVEHRYLEACGEDGPFQCVRTPRWAYAPPSVAYGDVPPAATGVQPYTDGAAWVNDLYERGGQDAVEAVFEDPPVSTEQTIHTERYPNETPTPIAYEDRAVAGWTTFAVGAAAPNGTDVIPIALGENGTERVGELGIFELFAYQELVYGIDVIDLQGYGQPDDGPYDFYNYTSAPSEGWENDRLVPYRRSAGNGTEYGYVWVTRWDSPADAEQFHDAYLEVLLGHGARRVAADTYVIDDGPFADAFHVSIGNGTVVVVNAPTVEGLSEIRPPDAIESAGEDRGPG